jgi:CHASE3 domain sensor protein
MLKTRSYAQRAADRAGLPTWARYLLIAGGAVISIVAILIYYSH